MEPAPQQSKTAPDPRPHLVAAMAETGRLVGGVGPDQLSGPTPCEDFDVEQLLGHLGMVLQRIGAAGRDEPPSSWPMSPTPCAGGDWSALWSLESGRAERGWAHVATLDRPTALPWGSFPAAEVIGVYTSEVIVHGWDLARATGQETRFDDATVATGFAALRGQMPAEGRQQLLDALAAMAPEGAPVDLPFDLAEPAPTGAPLLDQLVAWSGRDPSWTPS